MGKGCSCSFERNRRMHGSFLSILPLHYSLGCKTGKGEELSGEIGFRSIQIYLPEGCANVRRCPAYLLKTRNYLCPTDSAAIRRITVASVPTPERRLAARLNERCSGDLRDGHRRCNSPTTSLQH